MSTQTPVVVDDALLAQIDRDHAEAEVRQQRAESVARGHLIRAQTAARRVANLDVLRTFLAEHAGMPLADLLAEVERDLSEARVAASEARAVVDRRREELRDLEGYRRVMERNTDEIADEPEPEMGPVSEGTRALVAFVTGGGIRNRDLRVPLDDEDEQET